jgi:Domain of unknown function (DUF1704)
MGVSNKAFDEAVFKRYHHAKVSVLSGVKPDTATLIKTKKLFLSGAIAEPVLTYQKNVKIDYVTPELLLNELGLEVVKDSNLPLIVREQYELVIKEKLTKIQMLRQTQSLALGGNIDSCMELFQKCSDCLYGEIDSDIFYKVMQSVERDVRRAVSGTKFPATHAEAGDRLLNLVKAYASTQKHYASLEVTPKILVKRMPAITDAFELKKIFEEGFIEYGIHDGWNVVVDVKGTRSNISVSYDLKTIYLPSTEQLVSRSKRKRLTSARVKGLIAHEIGTHVVRKINGENSRLKLLGSGLYQYEQGEEGLATYREQHAKSLHGYAGLEAYLAIGLAKGFDGGGLKNFAQVHAILTDYYQVIENTTLEHAKDLAWNRGTSGTVPGVVFSKDIMYRHGNIRHWEAVLNNDFERVDIDSGKFDPTNKHHIEFLQKLAEL